MIGFRRGVGMVEFARMYSAWGSARKARRTVEKDREVFKILVKNLGDLEIREVETDRLERFLGEYRENHSPATCNIIIRHLKAALNWGLRRGIVKANACIGIKLFRVPKRYPKFLSDLQVGKLVHAAVEHSRPLYLYVLLGLYAGLRAGEIAESQWSWFDPDRRIITLEPNGSWIPKDRDSRRIPMHHFIREALPDPLPKGYIFVSGKRNSGHGQWRYYPRTAWKTIVKRAGLPADVTPHWMRHTFATRLVQAGEPLINVREYMGHSSTAVTEQYAHAIITGSKIDLLT